MKRTKKVIASLAIAGMALSMIPFNVLAQDAAPVAAPARLGGYTAAQTAVQIAEQTGWTGTAILSSSTSYGMVDALTAGPLATYLKAPILLQEAGNVLNPDTKAELIKLNVDTVYVTSGTAVISQAVLDQLTGMGIKVVSLGGKDRFETSVNIAKQMMALGANISKIAVAYGWLNQDALSIASIASAQTQPILLTDKDNIPASVREFLNANPSIVAADVIGGIGVVSESVKNQLPNATRHFGYTAYDTNLAVLKAYDGVLKFDRLFIANGETAIDALAGAPLAALFNAGIVLTKGTANEATAYAKSKLSSTSVVTALGGTAVVPEGVIEKVTPPEPEVPVEPKEPAKPGGGGGGGNVGGVIIVNKAPLITAITDATTLIGSKTVGTGHGNVTQAAKNAFQAVIDAANAVKNNAGATQAQVIAQVDALAAATNVFNAAVLVEVIIDSQVKADAISAADGQPLHVITSPIKVTADGVIIKNAKSEFDISLDPGAMGTVTLRNVQANNIIVLSGGKNSIYLENVIAALLKNLSKNEDDDADPNITHIKASGGSITRTESYASASFETSDGSLGTIIIEFSDQSPDGEPKVVLKGTFAETIEVGGGVELTAAEGAVIPEVLVATKQPGKTVTLKGAMQNVVVNGSDNTTIATTTGSRISNLVANTGANIVAPLGAEVSQLVVATNLSGQTVALQGAGTFGTVDVSSQEAVSVTLGDATTVNNVVTNSLADIFVPASAAITNAIVDAGATGSSALGGGTVAGNVTAPVDKTALTTAISDAETLIVSKEVGTDVGQVSQATRNAFQAAIDAATLVKDNATATKTQVETQVAALATATAVFNNRVIVEVGVVVNKTSLDTSLDSADSLLGSITVGTAKGNVSQTAYNAFKAVIDSAKAVYNDANALQAEVDYQVQALANATTAFNNAVITTDPVSKTALTTEITNATALLGKTYVDDVSLEARTAFQAVINAAKAVNYNLLAKQDQVDAQVAALTNGSAAFRLATKPLINDVSSISGAILDKINNTLTLSFSQVKRSSGIGVTKDSKLSLTIGASETIGYFNLKAGEPNTLLNAPLPTNQDLNLTQTNMTAIFNAIKNLEPSDKQALLNTVDFAKVLELVQGADQATQDLVFAQIGFDDFYAAVRNADPTLKVKILDNMTQVLDLALTDTNASEFKMSVIVALFPLLDEVNPALTADQKEALLNFIGNTDVTTLFESVNLSLAQKESILDLMNYTALFEAVMSDLSPTTRAAMFKAVNFTDLFTAMKSADDIQKAAITDNLVNVMNTIEASNISRAEMLDALVYGATKRDAIFQVLVNLCGSTSTGAVVDHVMVTVDLTDAAGNTKTYNVIINK